RSGGHPARFQRSTSKNEEAVFTAPNQRLGQVRKGEIMTMTVVDEGAFTFGHSPDPDDAFMFYGFHAGDVRIEVQEADRLRRWRVEHELQDIQTLNERALEGELEITAISAHAYPYVADRYFVMRTGVSMGDGY